MDPVMLTHVIELMPFAIKNGLNLTPLLYNLVRNCTDLTYMTHMGVIKKLIDHGANIIDDFDGINIMSYSIDDDQELIPIIIILLREYAKNPSRELFDKIIQYGITNDEEIYNDIMNIKD